MCNYDPSPGDITEDGCGLAPENEFSLWFYNYWKRFGSTAFDLIQIEVDAIDASLLLDKLSLIDDYAPQIAEKIHKREQDAKAAERPRRTRR